ncbi:hypothetical protein V6N13_045533 [Hibiscus sabdariffa]|uniref:Uncharacterized protein n=1 Tax=Hibiscus sabdariffa TaxID=183260 RepID=A0ABR2RLF7_9ROSI
MVLRGSYASSKETFSLHAAFESEREDEVTPVSDAPSSNPIDVIVISDDETSETPEDVTPLRSLLPKGCKPRKGVVVVRDFPIPPTRLQTPFSKVQHNRRVVVVRDFPIPPWLRSPFSGDSMVPSNASESEPSEEETSEYEPEELSKNDYMEEVASNFISPIVPLNQIGSTSFQTEEFSHKLSVEAEDPLDAQSDTEGYRKKNLKNSKNLSDPSSNQLPEKGQMPKPNAKASMVAVPSCRRWPRKRAFKSNPNREMIKVKRTKH